MSSLEHNVKTVFKEEYGDFKLHLNSSKLGGGGGFNSTFWILKGTTCNIMGIFAKYDIYLKKLNKEHLLRFRLHLYSISVISVSKLGCMPENE